MSMDSKLEFCKKVQYLFNKLTCEHENVPVKVKNPIYMSYNQVSYAIALELDDGKPYEASLTIGWLDHFNMCWKETTVSVWDIDIVEWEVAKMKKEKDVRSAYPGLPEYLYLENDLAAINRMVKSTLNSKSENVFGLYPEHIYYYDNNYTTVLWNDGTRTTVKLSDDDIYDEYSAFCAALAKRIYGSNSRIKKIIKAQGRFPLSKEDKKRKKEERKMRAEMKATQDLINAFSTRFRDIFGSEEE